MGVEGGLIDRPPFGNEVGGAFLDGDGDLGEAGMELFLSSWLPVDMLLTLRFGVKPNPPKEVLVDCLALMDVCFIAEDGLPGGLEKLPSLVPGLLPPLAPLRLRLDAGRIGGPIGAIGLSTGEKKLDRRLSFGVAGRFWILSIVLSLRDGRDDLLRSGAGGNPSMESVSGPSTGDTS